MWLIWVYGGTALSPLALWIVRRDWAKLARVSDRQNPPMGPVLSALGYPVIALVAFVFGGLAVPVVLVLMTYVIIKPEIHRHEIDRAVTTKK
jgi:hypothetical protein